MTTTPSYSVEYYDKEGPIHRNGDFPDKLVDTFDGKTTIFELMMFSFESRKDKPCLGWRPKTSTGWGDYVWTTYGEVRTQSTNFGAGLRFLGLQPKDRVGIYSKNRPEWIVTALGCQAHSIIIVPLYDTLGPNAAEYIINHAELSTVVVGKENIHSLLAVAERSKYLATIINMDPLDAKSKELSEKLQNVKIMDFDQVLKKGSQNPVPFVPPQPNDLYCIMYTSGTTGDPKGVMLTHRNIVADCAAGTMAGLNLSPSDVHLSYLPLAHVYEAVAIMNALFIGGSVGFYHGEITELLDDIQKLRPTILLGVPRVYNRISDGVWAMVEQSNSLKRFLFNYAYSFKLNRLKSGGGDSPFWNRLVFSKLQQLTGGRVRLMLSGAAPLSSKVQDFLRVVFMCDVIQGYGLTETTAGATLSKPEDVVSGHVGRPLPCCEIKLVDVPELGYTSNSKPPRGEICIRGPNVFVGYYKRPDLTKEAIDADGWFHTGDIGQWIEGGRLQIIDRKKNIFKLSQGEYVAGEYLETIYMRSRYVLQIYVYGDSFQSYLVAVVVPNLETLIAWAKQHEIKDLKITSVCQNARVKRHIWQELVLVAQQEKLKGFEVVKNIYLEPEQWTVENGYLTPSMKLKRPAIKKKYQQVIENLYKEGPLDQSKM
jgi:long-chain acyl-CoA synthetase